MMSEAEKLFSGYPGVHKVGDVGKNGIIKTYIHKTQTDKWKYFVQWKWKMARHTCWADMKTIISHNRFQDEIVWDKLFVFGPISTNQAILSGTQV